MHLEHSNTAFSFFNYLFLGVNADAADTIIRHELVHIRQKHSADIIFIELVKIVSWFNPFIYLLQRSLKAVHEYIADERTAAYQDGTLGYSTFLVNNAYGLSGSSVTHSFFNYNLLKKRIIMLNQKRSGKLARLKYLVAVPACAGMLCMSTLAFSKSYAIIDLLPHKADTALEQVHLLPPPPPPAPPAGKHTKLPPPPPVKRITSKGYAYKEMGYYIKGKGDIRVVITKKNGTEVDYFKSKCSPADLKTLKETYGYTFPDMPIYGKMPPPPPTPPVDPKKKSSVFGVILVPPPNQDSSAKPAKTFSFQVVAQNGAFNDLRAYLSNNVKYPAEAINNKSVGYITAMIDVKNQAVSDVSIANGFNTDCNNAIISAIKNYQGAIKTDAGTYKMIIEFLLISKDMQVVARAGINQQPGVGNFDGKTFAGIAQVHGYAN